MKINWLIAILIVLFCFPISPAGAEHSNNIEIVHVLPPLLGINFCEKYTTGDRYSAKGLTLKAIEAYSKLLLLRSDKCVQNSSVFARIAWMYYLSKTFDKAEKFAKQAIADSRSKQERAYFQRLLFSILVESARWNDALALFKQLPQIPNNTSESLLELELLCSAGQQSDFDKKFKIFAKQLKDEHHDIKNCMGCSMKDKVEILSTAKKSRLPTSKVKDAFSTPFNSNEWRESWQPMSPCRMTQSNYIIEKRVLIGKTRTDVRKLLGPPSYVAPLSPWLDAYPIGSFQFYEGTPELVSRRSLKSHQVLALVVAYNLDHVAIGVFVTDCGELGT